MAKLVGATGDNGYYTALDRAFGMAAPTPSGFCQFRSTISHTFFEDMYVNEINKWQAKIRPKFEGLFINAIDGDKLTIPVSSGILDEGYRGVRSVKDKETHYPAMYYCCATDLITDVPVGFSQSSKNDEISRDTF